MAEEDVEAKEEINKEFYETYREKQQQDSSNDENKEFFKQDQTTDLMDDDNDDSPADYEYSLRVENIRLKSRLEQSKEKVVALEREKSRYLEEYEKEKDFADKTNDFNHKLLREKQSLQEELKRSRKSLHHDDIKEVVSKLEHEIYVLEDRLDRQRKRYQQEHMMLYEDLKEERRKQQEWKHTYMKSQLAVMKFRRKINLLQDRISAEDKEEILKCLDIPVEPDSRLSNLEKFDAKLDLGSSVFKTKHHISSQPEIDKSISPNSTQSNEAVDKTNSDPSKSSESSSEVHTPKVFIMEGGEIVEAKPPEYIRLGSPQSHSHSSAKESHKIHSPRYESLANKFSSSYRHDTFTKYELDGNKYHSISFSNLPDEKTDYLKSSLDKSSSTRYKHWHTYSAENPGHQRGHLGSNRLYRVDLDNQSDEYRSQSPINDFHSNRPSDYRRRNENGDPLELNVNDTKFLELKFDNAFLKTDYKFSNLSTVKPPYVNRSTIDDRSSNPAGTPLESKKIWCLTCDGEVTKKPCGHTKNLVIQEKEKEFPCPTCGRLFNNRSHLKRHNMIHSGEKPWGCTYCEKRFNRKSHLNRHLLTHTGEKPFKCPYCGKGFADNSDLKRHKQVHESTPGFVPIQPKQILPAQATTKATPTATITVPSVPALFTSTIQAKRKEERRFPCNKCTKVFTRKSHLNRHKLTHDQQKIYCDCGRMFRQNSHLQAHLPACKRKREAIEAKYSKQHDLTSMSNVNRPASDLQKPTNGLRSEELPQNLTETKDNPVNSMANEGPKEDTIAVKNETPQFLPHQEPDQQMDTGNDNMNSHHHNNTQELSFDDDFHQPAVTNPDLNFNRMETGSLSPTSYHHPLKVEANNYSVPTVPGIPALIPDPV